MEKTLQPLSDPDEIRKVAALVKSPQPMAKDEAAVNSPVLPSSNVTVPPSGQAATSAPVPDQAIPSSHIYPQLIEPNDSMTQIPEFLTGSSMPEVKSKLPVGIYIIVGLVVVDFGLSFFRGTNGSVLVTFLSVVDLLLGAALLLRFELARQIAVILAAVTAILGSYNVVAMALLQYRLDQNGTNVIRVLDSTAAASTTSPQQVAVLNREKVMVIAQRKGADHDLIIAELNSGLGVLVCLGEAIYLTRPNVRKAFQIQEKR